MQWIDNSVLIATVFQGNTDEEVDLSEQSMNEVGFFRNVLEIQAIGGPGWDNDLAIICRQGVEL